MRKNNIRQYIFLLGVVVLFVLISTKYFFRIDLTAEKRYTLSAETKQVLRQLDEPVYFDIYLSGDMPAGFRKLRNSIREMLDDFRAYSGSRMSYRFIDPSESVNAKAREEQYQELANMGLQPVEVNKKNRDGSVSRQIIFPGAMVGYKGRLLSVNLLRNNLQSSEANLNQSAEMLEYELIKTIFRLSTDSIEKVAFTIGHGELSKAETYDIAQEYVNYYDIDRKAINGQLDALDPYKAVIIAKPQQAFDDKDQYVIDRYIMRGGKVLWLIDAVNVNTDSLFSGGFTFALASGLNLEGQLFNYGVRINPSLIQDMVYHQIPVTTGGASQVTFAPWLYYPLLAPSPGSVITRNLNPVWGRYVNDIDTVGMNPEIKKTVLLRSSGFTKTRAVPCMISLNEVEQIPEKPQFNKPDRITAILLEGRFPSIFRHRNVKNMFPQLQEKQSDASVDTKMIIVADGDIIRNDVRHTPQGTIPDDYPLGHDRYTRLTFGNKEFMVNALNYLTDDAGLMNLRNREFQLRLLNRQKTIEEQLKWQIINILIPILIILCGGLAYTRWRHYKYGRIINR